MYVYFNRVNWSAYAHLYIWSAFVHLYMLTYVLVCMYRCLQESCIDVCICMYICIYLYIYICLCKLYVYVHACMCISVYVADLKADFPNIRTHVLAYIHTPDQEWAMIQIASQAVIASSLGVHVQQ